MPKKSQDAEESRNLDRLMISWLRRGEERRHLFGRSGAFPSDPCCRPSSPMASDLACFLLSPTLLTEERTGFHLTGGKDHRRSRVAERFSRVATGHPHHHVGSPTPARYSRVSRLFHSGLFCFLFSCSSAFGPAIRGCSVGADLKLSAL